MALVIAITEARAVTIPMKKQIPADQCAASIALCESDIFGQTSMSIAASIKLAGNFVYTTFGLLPKVSL